MNEPQHWSAAYAATRDAAHVCLPPEQLLAAWDASTDDAGRARAIEAMADCAQCAAIGQIAHDLQAQQDSDAQALTAYAAAGTPRAAHRGDAATRPRRRPRVLRWAAAAAVVLGIATTSLLLREPAAPPVVRGETQADIAPASGSRLREAPQQLRWNAIGTAGAYQVELYDEGAQSLWRSERIAATSVELPAALRAQLQRGTFLWRVRAEGSEIEIGPFYFRVEP